MVKIVLAQINSCVGDLEYNKNKIISCIKRARSAGANILIFPELALTGYPPEDLLLKPHFIDENLRYLKIIEKESRA
jgi:NAD+ synthase (glutamine-hydrolysing)